MKFPMNKFGLKVNPVGAQVVMQYQGRTLLGDVVGVERDEVCGVCRLQVLHFNGEAWPMSPTALAVDVLERRSEA